MIDLLYVLGTLAFFAIMWAYTRACERLGSAVHHEEGETHER